MCGFPFCVKQQKNCSMWCDYFKSILQSCIKSTFVDLDIFQLLRILSIYSATKSKHTSNMVLKRQVSVISNYINYYTIRFWYDCILCYAKVIVPSLRNHCQHVWFCKTEPKQELQVLCLEKPWYVSLCVYSIDLTATSEKSYQMAERLNPLFIQ